jgi:hypothetical protein
MKDRYAIIKSTTIHHEGDERSRTNPGHGYPAWTETVQEIRIFDTKEQWLDYIERESLSRNPDNFIPIIFQEVEIEKSVKVKY